MMPSRANISALAPANSASYAGPFIAGFPAERIAKAGRETTPDFFGILAAGGRFKPRPTVL